MSNNYKNSTNIKKNFSQFEESIFKNDNELIDIDSKKYLIIVYQSHNLKIL